MCITEASNLHTHSSHKLHYYKNTIFTNFCVSFTDLLQVSTTQETYVVGEGNTLTAKCTSVGGRAPSDIRFFSPSGLLLHGTGRVVLTSLIQESTTSSSVTYSRTLKLSDALVGDSGTYTCEATNNEKSVFYFHVEGKACDSP